MIPEENPEIAQGQPLVQRKIIHTSSTITHGMHNIRLEKSDHGVTITYRENHVTIPLGPSGEAAAKEIGSMYSVHVETVRPTRTYNRKPAASPTGKRQYHRRGQEALDAELAAMSPEERKKVEQFKAKKRVWNSKSKAKMIWTANGKSVDEFHKWWEKGGDKQLEQRHWPLNEGDILAAFDAVPGNAATNGTAKGIVHIPARAWAPSEGSHPTNKGHTPDQARRTADAIVAEAQRN